jgi:hypothetical protein
MIIRNDQIGARTLGISVRTSATFYADKSYRNPGAISIL